MNKNKQYKILYIQHAGGVGGSAMSLLYTLEGVNRSEFDPIVALARPNAELEELYSKAGYKVIPWEKITLWDHSTVSPKNLYNPRSWRHLFNVIINWKRTYRSTIELVKAVTPDIVHLNSMPLSLCAFALKREGVPFVWHVREPPPDQGLRTRIIRYMMMQSDNLIFICEADRKAWVNGKKGKVIFNFVNFSTFNKNIDGNAIRQKYGITPNCKVLLYLGGLSEIKGLPLFLDAVGVLSKKVPSLKVLMPASLEIAPPTFKHRIVWKLLPFFGYGLINRKVKRKIRELKLENILIRLAFQKNIAPFIAASDVVVFPSTKPHFARPIIEAAAMGKPSVGSKLGGVCELIEDDKTGLLVEPGNSLALADALLNLLKDDEKRMRIGEAGYRKATEQFNSETQIKKILEVYREIMQCTR